MKNSRYAQAQRAQAYAIVRRERYANGVLMTGKNGYQEFFPFSSGWAIDFGHLAEVVPRDYSGPAKWVE